MQQNVGWQMNCPLLVLRSRIHRTGQHNKWREKHNCRVLAVFRRVTLISIILACLAAIIIHEGFHMLAAHIFGVALYSFRPTLVGIRARLKNTRSFRRQTIIYFAGPFGNFITALCICNSEGFLNSLFEANIAIGLLTCCPFTPWMEARS